MLKSLLKDIYSRTPVAREEVDKLAGDGQGSKVWLDELLLRMFQLMHNFEQDNFDADRYRNVPSNAFFADRHAAYFKLLLEHVERFYATRQLLADETSRALYDQLILFRILGHLHVRLPFNTPENRAQVGIADSW